VKCFETKSPEETRTLGMSIAGFLKPGDVLALKGELGSGKTTLIQGILKGLGFEGRVQSPSFIIVRTYNSHPEVRHVDLYRLEGKALDELHLEEIYSRNGIMLVEWADRSPWLPSDTSTIIVEFEEENGRRFLIEGSIEERMK
jgi:tRNA threonylcarbamoyladenosine biosynthesis protein TsaE